MLYVSLILCKVASFFSTFTQNMTTLLTGTDFKLIPFHNFSANESLCESSSDESSSSSSSAEDYDERKETEAELKRKSKKARQQQKRSKIVKQVSS